MSKMDLSATARLDEGIQALGIAMSPEAKQRLLAYLALLSKWNRVHNLTAVRDETAMVGQHLLDSLSVLPHLGGIVALADVGSGGGLPGIPLAMARPAMAITLIESSQKKASFLQQAKIELKLSNVSIHCGRVEDFEASHSFEAVISRAFSSLAEFVRVSGHLLVPGGRLLAMKGNYPAEEIALLPPSWRVVGNLPLEVPGLSARRHLIVIEKPL